MSDKPSEHFSWRELDRYGDRTASATANLQLLADALEVVRAEAMCPIGITPNGGYHGAKMDEAGHKRSPGSQHRKGKAADLVPKGISLIELHRIILRLMRDGKIPKGGVGRYGSFVHIDIRGYNARWGRKL
jgi:uncharacterized protein YcbK (DUF882 family)